MHRMSRSSICLVSVVAVCALACGGLAPQPKISSMCSVGWDAADCNFTNTGEGEGIACVKVKLKSEATGAWLESEAVCSGKLGPGTSSGKRSFDFVGDVKSHCPKGVKDSCEMEIVNIE